MKSSLRDTFEVLSEQDIISRDVHPDVTDNLAARIKLRPYQIEALGRWFHYMDNYRGRSSNPNLLFYMANREVQRGCVIVILWNQLIRVVKSLSSSK